MYFTCIGKCGLCRSDDSGSITAAGEGQIGVGCIGNNLNLFCIETLSVEIRGKGNGQFNFVFPEKDFQFFGRVYNVFYGEIFVGIDAIDKISCIGVCRRNQYGGLYIFTSVEMANPKRIICTMGIPIRISNVRLSRKI